MMVTRVELAKVRFSLIHIISARASGITGIFGRDPEDTHCTYKTSDQDIWYPQHAMHA